MLLGIPTPYLAPLMGAALWLTICFQVSLGLRWIVLGRHHYTIHKWIGVSLAVLGPVHGLWATSVFLGWPFRLG